MQSRYSHVEEYSKEESLQFWVGQNPPGDTNTVPNRQVGPDGVTLELSEQAQALLAQHKTVTKADDENGLFEITDGDKLKIALLEKMLQLLTGKKVKIRVLDNLSLKEAKNSLKTAVQEGAFMMPPRQGWGLRYELHESYYERETVSFSAGGVIKTADGREITFSTALNMSREFMTRTDISLRAGDAAAVDPLVINYDGGAPGLTGTKFSFDLDSDGKADQISFARPGSGFLSLDKNGDGVINDGGELFGPGTGNGFAELAQYDGDGNGWIDENDPIFDRLRIWTKDEAGRDVLFALGQKGVGAIYLGNIDTDFSIRDSANRPQAQMTTTGIFVKEDGTVGTVQQLDLVI
jgi:hypothetical protein